MSMHAHIHLINSIILDLAFIERRFPDMRSSGEGSPDYVLTK